MQTGYGNGTWNYALPSTSTVTVSGHRVTIHFDAPLTNGGQYYFQFNPDSPTIKDLAGNSYNQYISTSWIYPSAALNFNGGYFSQDGRWMSLDFSGDGLLDRTIVDRVSLLKEQITVSTDNGATFSALDLPDTVSIHGRSINVLFHIGKKEGSVKVKIAANVLSDLHDNQRNAAVDQVIASNTPDVTGYFLSNAASEFTFADNAEWRSNVRDVRISDDTTETDRDLDSSEYSLTAGKLTLKNGLFLEGHYYYVSLEAEGYSSKHFDGETYTSSEIFYMTAPVVTSENGITAKINVFNNARYGTSGNQSVVFELMKGSTPVSIVAADLRVDTGTYTANFNVSDVGPDITKSGYTVKAYVVSKYSSDSTDPGLNLATVVTQSELEQVIFNANQNNNNDW